MNKWDTWSPELYNDSGLPLPPDELMPPLFKIHLNTKKPENKWFTPFDSIQLDLIENKLLTPEGYDRDVRHYVFDLKDKNIKYNVGDCLGIFPYNDSNEVDHLLDRIKLKGEDVLDVIKNDNSKIGFHTPISTRQLFTEVLDIFGKPGRRFYEFLSMAVDNENDRKYLKHLLTKDGSNELKDLMNKE